MGKPPLSYQTAKDIFEKNVLYHSTLPELAWSVLFHVFDHSSKPPKQEMFAYPLYQPDAADKMATYEDYVELMKEYQGWSQSTIEQILLPGTEEWEVHHKLHQQNYDRVVVHPEIMEEIRAMQRQAENSWDFYPNLSLHFDRLKASPNLATCRVLLPPKRSTKLWTRDLWNWKAKLWTRDPKEKDVRQVLYGPNKPLQTFFRAS